MDKEKQNIALVNDRDQVTGYKDKLEVHRQGLLHRAFSIVVINRKGQWLLHQRALDKYHSGGSWTNTCCSHLGENETMESACKDRLMSEMGILATPEFIESFHYEAKFENGLIENEIDHVYIAFWEGDPEPDPEEVMDWKWMDPEEIKADLKRRPQDYSAWFPLIFDKFGVLISEKTQFVPGD